MPVVHVDFQRKRELSEIEIEDRACDAAGILQDPVIRMARAIAAINERRRKDNEIPSL